MGNGLVILPLFERVWMFKIVFLPSSQKPMDGIHGHVANGCEVNSSSRQAKCGR
jgi:hypothetical protein